MALTSTSRWSALGLACVAALALFALSAGAGTKLTCRKGEPSADRDPRVLVKVFDDDVPRVSAIEKARARGRERDGRTTVRILALRVQFQPDSDSRSTGGGVFDYGEWDGATFDGPPHDREYFELHMTALESYYESVSYGRLDLEFDVAPADTRAAYILPHDMGYYHDYSEEQIWYVDQVELFTRDAFAAADTTDTLDFSRYDGFVLFHAGADWQSDIYLDSPFDLPSAHISLGEPILVNDGAVEVWDAALMPETSSQDGLTIVLNGTLAHEVGHVLGLPDLYNTSNFFPGIGYWGIMDGGGRIGLYVDAWDVYAYGLIPGPPCAWSKEYLGWLDPVVIADDADRVPVKGSALRGEGERLYKIPITSDEYFLIENRLDDIGGDFTVAIEQERGVVLGPVDPACQDPICPVNHEYDYLMPGPGLVIYHIDDTRVIPGLMPYDAVNIDRHRRGVAVEEADGIIDIGYIGSFYWNGNAYDPFYAANNDSFSWDTYPATDNNLGAKTYLKIVGISDAPDTVMTMNVRFDRWKPGWPIDIGEPIGRIAPRVVDLDGDGRREIVVAARSGSVYAWHADGSPVVITPPGDGSFASVPGGISMTPAVADLDGDGDNEIIVASDAGSLYVWHHSDGAGDGLRARGFPVAIDGPATGGPIAADLDGAPGLEIAVASRGGDLSILDSGGRHVDYSPYAFGHLTLNDVTLAAGDFDGDGFDEIVMSTTNRGWIVVLNADGSEVSGWPVTVDSWAGETVGLLVGDLDRAPDGAPEVVGAASNGEVRVWNGRGGLLRGWPLTPGGGIAARGALGDLEGDGHLEIVLPVGAREVVGLRWNGTRAENWPLDVEPGDSASVNSSSPLIGDVDGDGDLDVLVGGPDGNLFAWDAVSGDLLPGWPLSSDPALGAAWIGDAEGDGEADLLVAGDRGRVLFYRLPYAHEPGEIVWPTQAGTPAGTGCYSDSLLAPAPEDAPGLLVPERSYCYPNPANGEDPVLRVFLEERAKVEIEIFDVTGQLVDRIERDGVRGPQDIRWDVSDVASGLYIVRVEARRPGAGFDIAAGSRTVESEVKIMKVAVVR